MTYDLIFTIFDHYFVLDAGLTQSDCFGYLIKFNLSGNHFICESV